MSKEKTDRDTDLEVSGQGHMSGGSQKHTVRPGLRSGVPEKHRSGPGLTGQPPLWLVVVVYYESMKRKLI
jgi:hypothetical protein